MIALRLHDKGDLRLHEEPVPTPDEDEVLVRVTAVGLCGSDLHWFREGAIGDVVSDPAARPRSRVRRRHRERARGRVSGSRSTPRSRAAGARRASPATRTSASPAGLPGTRSTARSARDWRWPERLAHRAARLARRRRGHAARAARRRTARARPRSRASRHDGGRVRLRPARPPARPAAAARGRGRARGNRPARRTASRPRRRSARPSPSRRAGRARRSCPRRAADGVDVAFEVAGEDDAIATAIDTLRPGGRLVLVGIPTDDRSSFTASTARRKGLTISLCRRMKATDLPRAIDLAEQGRIELSLTHQRAVCADRGLEAFASLSEQARVEGRRRAAAGDRVTTGAYAVGVDFGTESGRAVLVDVRGRPGARDAPSTPYATASSTSGCRRPTTHVRLEPGLGAPGPDGLPADVPARRPARCSPRPASTRPT